MYTLRIIEQKDGLETRSNFFLGKNYTVHCRVPLEENEMRREWVKPLFETRLESFVGEEDLKTMLTDDVVGFIVNDKESITLFYKDQSVYIVNDDGKTFERVYGMYEKK